MDKRNVIFESEKLLQTLVTLFVPSFCSNPNALGYSIFSDDRTGMDEYDKSPRTINTLQE